MTDNGASCWRLVARIRLKPGVDPVGDAMETFKDEVLAADMHFEDPNSGNPWNDWDDYSKVWDVMVSR